ncbi:MAG: kelch repeat-containing protein [Armatimonadota bacterium]|jgi:hypothetical protein
MMLCAGVAAMLISVSDAQQPSTLNQALLAMPDNSWLNLKPKGTANARMYSGACFGGGYLWHFGGAHRSYKGNDVELYDPVTNEWIQATEPEWPEIGSDDWKKMIGGGGTTTRLSPTGRPFTEHTYQQVCWQPGRQRFFIVLVSSGTWEFDPKGRQWIHLINRFTKEKPDPRGAWSHNNVLYEPSLEAPVLITGGGGATDVYRFDHESVEWKHLTETPQELRWNEFYSTYVPEWKAHLIATAKRGFYRLEVPAIRLTPVDAPDDLGRCQSLSYDMRSGVVIALFKEAVDERRQTVAPWAFDVKTEKWTELRPPEPRPVGQTTGQWGVFWYDERHNVHLLINAVRRDRQELFDGGVTETWAYRFREAARE